MAFSRPATQREMDFIRESWRDLPAREIAARLGRTERFVYKKINDMRLREEPSPAPVQRGPSEGAREAPSEPPAASDRERLCSLRALLWERLRDAPARDTARLSEEYREVLASIAAIDAAEAEEGGSSPVAEIIKLVRTA